MAMSTQASHHSKMELFQMKASNNFKKPEDEYHHEFARLRTFTNWPEYVHIRPQILARHGMVYKGEGDEVMCFFCNVHLSHWKEGDSIMGRHRQNSPNCVLLARVERAENVPLVNFNCNLSLKQMVNNMVAGNYNSSEPAPYTSFQPTDSGYSGDPEGVHVTNMKSPAASTSLNQNGSSYNLCSNGSSVAPHMTSDQKISQSLPAKLRKSSPLPYAHEPETHPPLVSSLYQQGDVGNLRQDGRFQVQPNTQTEILQSSVNAMRNETARFESYSHFSPNANVEPQDLARAGFFYVGPGDRVRCAFCNLNLHNWEVGDNPHVEHQRYAPTCPFIRGDDVGNIPIVEQGSVSVGQQNTTREESGAQMANNVVLERPKHPEMAIEVTRTNSYKDWPESVSQRPEQLARAGFYYAGVSDHVKCFFCDGGLRNWEAGDDPWAEHARWFPRCGYVRQSQGEAFVKAVQARYSDQPKPEVLRGQPAAPSVQAVQAPGIIPLVTPDQVEAQMQRAEVQAVMEMGFSRDMVSKALEKKLRIGGPQSLDVQSLLDAVIDLETSMEQSHSLPGRPAVQLSQPSVTASAPEPSAVTETSGKNKKKKRNRGNKSSSAETQPSEEEKEKLQKRIKEIEEQRLCKVCMDAEFNIVFLPCGHLVCCSNCAPALRNCPICRTLIRGTVRTYWS